MHTQSLIGLWQTQLPLRGHNTAEHLLPSRLQRAACHAATSAVAQERVAGQASTSGRSASERLAPGIADRALLGRTLPELQHLVASQQQPQFRAKQLLDHLLQGRHDLADFTNVPQDWRAQLQEQGFHTGRSQIVQEFSSPDGTRKFLLRLADGRAVETVGIPDKKDKRLTVCVSSQVGCAMACTFCATGKAGFARNLAAHEILDQVMVVGEAFKARVSHVVYMGQGEATLNLRNVLKSVDLIRDQLGIGARRITISTVGVPNAISKLAEAKLQSTLAVSLHAPTQRLRAQLVPSAGRYPLEALLEDCRAYVKTTGRRPTFEYTLLAGVNDSIAQAGQLAKLLRSVDMHCHVNLIPWNPVPGLNFERPSNNCAHRFQRELQAAKVSCTLRDTRGLEAAAACGQLSNISLPVAQEQEDEENAEPRAAELVLA